MLTIIDERDSGKAEKLLAAARQNNAFIITQNKRAFQVKAHNLGYDDITIVDYDDLQLDNYPIALPALVHNGDKMLHWLLSKYFLIDALGFSATKEN